MFKHSRSSVRPVRRPGHLHFREPSTVRRRKDARYWKSSFDCAHRTYHFPQEEGCALLFVPTRRFLFFRNDPTGYLPSTTHFSIRRGALPVAPFYFAGLNFLRSPKLNCFQSLGRAAKFRFWGWGRIPGNFLFHCPRNLPSRRDANSCLYLQGAVASRRLPRTLIVRWPFLRPTKSTRSLPSLGLMQLFLQLRADVMQFFAKSFAF